jgi:hypothetical protein
MTTTATLVRGRLRPVPWGRLGVFGGGWFLLTALLAGGTCSSGTGVVVFQWAAFLLGLGGAVLAAPETDPAREVLRAGALPWWRTLALRLGGWMLLGGLPVLVMAVRLDGAAGWTTAELAWGTLPNFLLVSAVCFLAARVTSVLGGGGAAIAVVATLLLAGRAWPQRFPIQLSSVPGAAHWQASRAWMVVGAATLVALALLAELGTGTRPGVPRRREKACSGPASDARVES